MVSFFNLHLPESSCAPGKDQYLEFTTPKLESIKAIESPAQIVMLTAFEPFMLKFASGGVLQSTTWMYPVLVVVAPEPTEFDPVSDIEKFPTLLKQKLGF